MKTLSIILQLLSYAPMIQPKPAVHPGPALEGTGYLLIANCQPGSGVIAEPGHLSAVADKEGVARIQAPAQRETDDSYKIFAGGHSFDLNGTLSARESLSGVCP